MIKETRVKDSTPPQPPIHATAVIEEDVEIGPGTTVRGYCHLSKGVRIGADCVLGSHVYADGGVVVGAGSHILDHVSLQAGVTLERDVYCGPAVVFAVHLNPRAASAEDPPLPIRVGRGATLGAHCTINGGVTIGRHALVGSGAVVTRDVPDYGLVYGVPARRQGWVCKCGIKLAIGSRDAICHKCGTEYVLTAPEQLIERD